MLGQNSQESMVSVPHNASNLRSQWVCIILLSSVVDANFFTGYSRYVPSMYIIVVDQIPYSDIRCNLQPYLGLF